MRLGRGAVSILTDRRCVDVQVEAVFLAVGACADVPPPAGVCVVVRVGDQRPLVAVAQVGDGGRVAPPVGTRRRLRRVGDPGEGELVGTLDQSLDAAAERLGLHTLAYNHKYFTLIISTGAFVLGALLWQQQQL